MHRTAQFPFAVFDQPSAFWTIWPFLSGAQRLFLVLLFAISLYCLFSLTIVLVRLRSKANTNDRAELLALQSKTDNLRQLLAATLYLFGFVFFLSLQASFFTADERSYTFWEFSFKNLLLNCVFAMNVFVFFLVLHSAQWYVSHRVRSRLAAGAVPG